MKYYMIVPLDLTLDEEAIYKLLYMKCDFSNMTSKYTLDQLVLDLDERLKIDRYKANRVIKKLLNSGYIEVISQGKKGNPTVYKIKKINEIYEQISNESAMNVQRINDSISGFEENTRTKAQQKHNKSATPIKDKEEYIISKDIISSSKLQPIIDKWNLLNLSKVYSINQNTNRYKLLNARLKEYGEGRILEAIDNINYSSFLKGQNNKNWIITFDWFIKPNNFVKVLEGNYKDKETQKEMKQIYD